MLDRKGHALFSFSEQAVRIPARGCLRQCPANRPRECARYEARDNADRFAAERSAALCDLSVLRGSAVK